MEQNEKVQTPKGSDLMQTMLLGAVSILTQQNNQKHPDTHIPYIVTKTTNDEGKTIGEEITSLEHLLEHPIRKRGTRQFTRADSFIDYVNAHKITNRTTINVKDIDQFNIVANLDDNEMGASGQAGWNHHAALYSPKFTREINEWSNKNGKVMKQAEFAHFIETNLLDIAQPAGADLLEIVKTLEAKKKVNFKSGVRLDNGDVCLNYEETTESKAGEKGQFSIPSTINLAIPIYKGGDPYQIEANFRYRIEDGSLTMWYELVRIHTIIEHAQTVIVEQVKSGIADVPVYYGSY